MEFYGAGGLLGFVSGLVLGFLRSVVVYEKVESELLNRQYSPFPSDSLDNVAL
jgi:hypothetical protein